ncbi:30S ribosomal protein S11 [Patescibacteria group bacterium]|nr:30S ribosomal protein S11 [Patescibacteria group bacterium]
MSEDKAQKAKKEEEIKEDSKLEEVELKDEKEIQDVLKKEDKKTEGKKEDNNKETKKSKKDSEEVKDKPEKEDEEESDIFSSADDEELPEEIKAKLEKNKLAREKVNKKKQKKKKKKGPQAQVKVGKAYIKATYNNTIVTLTDLQGGVISWASAGVAGFKGPKKATPYAAQIITKIATMKAKEEYDLKEVAVFASGVGTGKESAIRALNANGLKVTAIKDVTPVPHNGCRPKKPRRV